MGDDNGALGAVRECATTINSFLDGTDRKESILSEILKSGAFNHLKTMAGLITLLQGQTFFLFFVFLNLSTDFPVQACFAEIIYRVLVAVGTPFSKR